MIDPYSVLGVSRDASDDEDKESIPSDEPANIIRMQILIIPTGNRLRRSLNRSSRPMNRSCGEREQGSSYGGF